MILMSNGDECYADYGQLLTLVANAGFKGWIEVEYEVRDTGQELRNGPQACDDALGNRRLPCDREAAPKTSSAQTWPGKPDHGVQSPLIVKAGPQVG